MDVKTLCLGVLMRRSASGYAIKKEVESGIFSHFCEAGYGSIYPALNKLWADGLVVAREENQEGRPDRKIYEITPAGEEAFAESLLSSPAPDKFRSDELFILFFAECLPVKRIETILDIRLQRLRAEKSAIEAYPQPGECENAFPNRSPSLKEIGSEFTRQYGSAIISAEIEFLEDARERLLHALRTLKDRPNLAAE